jgi:hypothetical protein
MRDRSRWFDVYAATILESDVEHSNVEEIFERVASARRAIADRIAQLEAGELAGNREARDLEDALNKLQILVNVSGAMKGSQPDRAAQAVGR